MASVTTLHNEHVFWLLKMGNFLTLKRTNREFSKTLQNSRELSHSRVMTYLLSIFFWNRETKFQK